nr:NB-ARC domains-containing protein [Tanacetum cinerariifolium]
MVELILSALLPIVIEKLASAAVNKISRSKEIHSELKKWRKSLPMIQDVLNDASQKEVTEAAVKQWLNSLQHLAYDIDDILDDMATEAMDRVSLEKSNKNVNDAYDEPIGDMKDMVDNPSPQSTPQVLPSFEVYTPLVTYLKEVNETIEILVEVELLDHTKLVDLSLNTYSHDLFLSFRKIPSVDEPEP